MAIKTLTVKSNPKNKIIKALVKKGYTGIKVERYSAQERCRGYTLECDQVSWTRIGSCLESAISNIEKLPKVLTAER